MHQFIQKFSESYRDQLLGIIRIFTAILFIEHPLALVFGLFGGLKVDGGKQNATVPPASFLGVMLFIQLIIAVALLVGFLTRMFALLGFIIMVGAYLTVHVKDGFVPIANHGELALVYGALFFMFGMVTGSGAYAVDNRLLSKLAENKKKKLS